MRLDVLKIKILLVYLIDIFKDKKSNYEKILDSIRLEELELLGFNDERNEKFINVYGKASNNADELEMIIDDIEDPYLLANAIYSRFKYFKNTCKTPEIILNDANRRWFLLALNRMYVLVEVLGFEIEEEIPNATKEEVAELFVKLLKTEFEKVTLVRKKLGYIEIKYLVEFGALENTKIELKTLVEIHKRQIELIKEGIEKKDLSIDKINEKIKEEFYEKILNINKKKTLEKKMIYGYESTRTLSVEEIEKMSMLFFMIKKVKYELDKKASDEEYKIFSKIDDYFEKNDLDKMLEAATMIDCKRSNEVFNELSLGEKKMRLLKKIYEEEKYIQRCQESYPYTLNKYIESKEAIQNRKAELEEYIKELNESIEVYTDKINKLLEEYKNKG